MNGFFRERDLDTTGIRIYSKNKTSVSFDILKTGGGVGGERDL